ncbi:hypothetical protein C0J52_20721 [Blattella germanica]|nr:hypothetical protein C0J52_20721 [Blattella germanica]
MPFPPSLDCQYITIRAFSLSLLLPCGRYRTAFSAAKGLDGSGRLCLSSARAISVKCFIVHAFIYSDQMVSSIPYLFILYTYLFIFELCTVQPP